MPATTSHGRQTRHVVSPLIAIERVEQPAIEFGRPHNTGQGGFYRMETDQIKLSIPPRAKEVQYWIEAKSTPVIQLAGPQTKWWSNYGKNFRIAVK